MRCTYLSNQQAMNADAEWIMRVWNKTQGRASLFQRGDFLSTIAAVDRSALHCRQPPSRRSLSGALAENVKMRLPYR